MISAVVLDQLLFFAPEFGARTLGVMEPLLVLKLKSNFGIRTCAKCGL